jgi:hypothetical protein
MSRFAVNGKNGKMKTMQDIYARFADMVEELQQKGGEPDYRKICRKLGVAPASLDEVLESELGMSGNELLESIWSHTPER